MSDLVRKRIRRKGQPEEIRISASGDATATIALTGSTPEEAWLALLDLDVTAEDVRGKTLRWDNGPWSGVPIAPKARQPATLLPAPCGRVGCGGCRNSRSAPLTPTLSST
jgi:hypothetical protein